MDSTAANGLATTAITADGADARIGGIIMLHLAQLRLQGK
jgi:hypothetical protein